LRTRISLRALFAALCLLLPIREAQADVGVGPHLGVNLENGDLHLGADVVIDIAQISPSVKLAVWPSYAHIFRDDADDGDLFAVDFPFVFAIDGSIVSPYVGPGLALSIFDDARLRLDVIGGMFFAAGPVRPFTGLALRFIDDTNVDLLIGVLFEL
jgi:hypothetical protein